MDKLQMAIESIWEARKKCMAIVDTGNDDAQTSFFVSSFVRGGFSLALDGVKKSCTCA